MPGHPAGSLSSCIESCHQQTELVFSGMSLMKVRNSRGPRTLPCGKPEVTGRGVVLAACFQLHPGLSPDSIYDATQVFCFSYIRSECWGIVREYLRAQK